MPPNGASRPAAACWRAIVRRSAGPDWPTRPGGSRRFCPNGDKAGPNPVAVCATTGLNPSCMDEPAHPANPDGFTADGPDVIAPGEGELIVNLEGFEGPLDLLLSLARDQKVDLRRISMVALVDQYLAHVAQARRMRLELAAEDRKSTRLNSSHGYISYAVFCL